MITRLYNAAQFYRQELKREAEKEIAFWKAIHSGKPNIAYMGWVGHNNLGDEILYDAHRVLFPEFNVIPFRKSKSVDLYERLSGKSAYRAGFLGGGTLINQSDSWLKQISHLQEKGLPIYCLGTGVTESNFRAKHEQTSLDTWINVLRTFKYVGIRGPRSKSILQDAGFNNFSVTGDTALSLAPVTSVRSNAKIIGFNYGLVKENQIWGSVEEYTQNVAACINMLIDKGYRVVLLPVWDKDLPSNRRLLKQVNNPKCTMTLAFNSLDEYSRELSKCNYFIGQKLHATIMACMQRIPSIMIEYQPKCRDFMESVAMEDYILKTSECTPQKLMAMLDMLKKNDSSVRCTLEDRVMGYRQIQFKEAKRISKQLIAHS